MVTKKLTITELISLFEVANGYHNSSQYSISELTKKGYVNKVNELTPTGKLFINEVLKLSEKHGK
jgi:predicted transcriptional regulator